MSAAWMEIDLGVVEDNTRAVKAAIAPRRLLASLKADAYGHGLVAVAGAVVRGGADMLAVVAFDDAIRLRAAGIEQRVLVYSGEPLDAERCRVAHEHRLIVTVVDPASAGVVIASGLEVTVAVEVETGFDRLGCRPEDLPSIVDAIDRCPTTSLVGVYTHLGAYDRESPSFDEQYACFASVLDRLRDRAREIDLVAAASSPVVEWTDRMDLDWVDVGRLLLGIRPASPLAGDTPRVEVRPALRRIATRLGQVRGEQGHRIGVIPLGRAAGMLALGATHVTLPQGVAPVLSVDLEHARLDLGHLDAATGDLVIVHDAAHGAGVDGLGAAWTMPTIERRYVAAPT